VLGASRNQIPVYAKIAVLRGGCLVERLALAAVFSSAVWIRDKCGGVWWRRPLALYLLAQNLVFCNSDLDKLTTVCKVGDLEVFPTAFLDLETYTRP